ncbi:vitellogenin receptor-like [Ceratina calcarata]|nr:vitellogenin receptor-like [Ceratina calcarata]
MCVTGVNGPTCICHDGYPKSPEDICTREANGNIKFESQIVGSKDAGIRRSSGTLVGVTITVVAFIVIVVAYVYYQKIKPIFSKTNNICIQFQNPSYERQCEAFDCVSSLPPGEHEYVNPITDIQKDQYQNDINQKTGKQIIKLLNFDDEPGRNNLKHDLI